MGRTSLRAWEEARRRDSSEHDQGNEADPPMLKTMSWESMQLGPKSRFLCLVYSETWPKMPFFEEHSSSYILTTFFESIIHLCQRFFSPI